MGLNLPTDIASKADLIAVLRNVEDVLETYTENKIREFEGIDFASRPDVSSNLAALVAENELEVTFENLKILRNWLRSLKESAPVVRFTFASDPNPDFLGKLVAWLRRESGELVLVRYGIQPTIGAGCIMYTPSKRFDFTLKAQLKNSKDKFLEVLGRV